MVIDIALPKVAGKKASLAFVQPCHIQQALQPLAVELDLDRSKLSATLEIWQQAQPSPDKPTGLLERLSIEASPPEDHARMLGDAPKHLRSALLLIAPLTGWYRRQIVPGCWLTIVYGDVRDVPLIDGSIGMPGISMALLRPKPCDVARSVVATYCCCISLGARVATYSATVPRRGLQQAGFEVPKPGFAANANELSRLGA